MRTSNVQPITPYQPTTAVQVASQTAPKVPETPTTPSVAATAPVQNISNFNAVKQLPSQTVTAMASQQAVDNGTLSQNEKIKKGIIPGAAGVSLKQVSAPGQAVKPGAGEFAQSLQQKVPTLSLDKVAHNVLMTGTNGVNSAQNLVKNTAAQLGAVSNSVQKATTNLTNLGILTGKEQPTQIAGVVMAAATIGVPQVAAVLSNPVAAVSAIGNAVSGIGKAITSGNFAAGMADKLSSGLSGVATGLAGLANGALSGLSSGISDFVNKAAGGLGALVSGLGGAAQNAFNVAEKSFGDMKAGVENALGGLAQQQENAPSALMKKIQELDVMKAEVSTALDNFYESRLIYIREGTEESLGKMQEASNKLKTAEQKYEQARSSVAGGNSSNTDLLGGIVSAQSINTLGSSLFNAPNSTNTGINSLPGGIGAFAGQVGNAVSSAVGAVKGLASQAAGVAGSALGALANPGALVGNLVSNVQSALGSAQSLVSQGINAATGLLGSAQSAVNNLVGGAKSAVSGLMSNISSALGGLGNAPGQIKNAIMAVNTFPDKAAITSTLAAATSEDPKVPPITFEEVEITIEPDEYQLDQVNKQLEIKELIAEREFKSFELDQAIDEYLLNPDDPDLIVNIDIIKVQIDIIDKEIAAAQEEYDKILFNS